MQRITFILLLTFLFDHFNVVAQTPRDNEKLLATALVKKDTIFVREYWNYYITTHELSFEIPDYFFKPYGPNNLDELLFVYELGLLDLNTEVYFETTLLDILVMSNHIDHIQEAFTIQAKRELLYKNSITPLMIMARRNRPDLVFSFLNKFDSSATDASGGNLFNYCGNWEKPTDIERLVSLGVNICTTDFFGKNILSQAVRHGNTHLAEFLLDTYECLYDPTKNRLLDMAMFSGNLPLINLFSSLEKTYLNQRDISGTPLLHRVLHHHSPASNHHLFQAIQVLINAGYDINAVDEKGNPALAYCQGNIPLFKFLIDNGAKIDWQNNQLQTLSEVIVQNTSTSHSFYYGENSSTVFVNPTECIIEALYMLVLIDDWRTAEALYRKYQSSLQASHLLGGLPIWSL